MSRAKFDPTYTWCQITIVGISTIVDIPNTFKKTQENKILINTGSFLYKSSLLNF